MEEATEETGLFYTEFGNSPDRRHLPTVRKWSRWGCNGAYLRLLRTEREISAAVTLEKMHVAAWRY